MFISNEIISSFAIKRNKELSFAYLKENGELLSIAASSGLLVEPAALDHYRAFYDSALDTCKFYSPYFRFILSLVLWLEDLGYEGAMGERICNYVVEHHFLDFETSDTRRLEILTLLTRRRKDNASAEAYRQRITESVDVFISDPDQFTRFNKPLFYELTHFIFFLTEYGQTELPLKNDPTPCLINIGILSLLDNDIDLLAEVCICFRFLGKTAPSMWEAYVEKKLKNIEITFENIAYSEPRSTSDEYHPYLMGNWLLALKGLPVFTENLKHGTPYFSFLETEPSILETLSDHLYETLVAKTKSSDQCVASLVKLSDTNQRLLTKSLSSTPQTSILLSKYSQGIFNEKSLSILGR